MGNLQTALARARQEAHYSQDEVGAALGVSRSMISYWEAGSRTPNDRQLSGLARLYRVQLADLLAGREPTPARSELAGLMMRSNGGVDPGSAPGIHEFVRFLDRHAELAEMLSLPLHGWRQSPFVHRTEFSGKGDISRKAEEVRSHLRVGVGPIPEVEAICKPLGITLYHAPLGADLGKSPSGAFLNHPKVGFAILVNLDTTPGRRRFTIAHEIGHALFHSDEERVVVSQSGGSKEGFADEFAGEFLMPREGVRRFMEEWGMPPRIEDAADVIHVQRYFRVSWAMALVRLSRLNFITAETFGRHRNVGSVALAHSLGYPIDPDEIRQDASRWQIRRFPRSFLRMLRVAVLEGLMSVPTAAAFAGLAIPEVVQLLGYSRSDSEDERSNLEESSLDAEFGEYESSGVCKFACAA